MKGILKHTEHGWVIEYTQPIENSTELHRNQVKFYPEDKAMLKELSNSECEFEFYTPQQSLITYGKLTNPDDFFKGKIIDKIQTFLSKSRVKKISFSDIDLSNLDSDDFKPFNKGISDDWDKIYNEYYNGDAVSEISFLDWLKENYFTPSPQKMLASR
jgi:hypothetical protein